MRKLKLDVDELTVESFAIPNQFEADGTVHARVGDPDPITIGDGDTYDYCATNGTCIGPTYCCPETWRPTCASQCFTCVTLWCDTCIFDSCRNTCQPVHSCIGDCLPI